MVSKTIGAIIASNLINEGFLDKPIKITKNLTTTGLENAKKTAKYLGDKSTKVTKDLVSTGLEKAGEAVKYLGNKTASGTARLGITVGEKIHNRLVGAAKRLYDESKTREERGDAIRLALTGKTLGRNAAAAGIEKGLKIYDTSNKIYDKLQGVSQSLRA